MNLHQYESQISWDFDYRISYREVKKGYFRPIVTAEFTYDGFSASFPMLVDTGADNVVVPIDLKDLFGINNEKCEIIPGRTFYGDRLAFQGPELCIKLPDLSNIPITSHVLFAEGLNNFGYGLLGRDVLNKIRICFTHQLEEAFYLSIV